MDRTKMKDKKMHMRNMNSEDYKTDRRICVTRKDVIM